MSREKVAKTISNIFNPYYLSAPFFLFVAITTTDNLMMALAYWLVSAVFFSFLPVWDIGRRVSKGLVTDPHINRREDRIRPFLFSLFCAVAGLVAVYLIGAPVEMRAISWSVVIMGVLITLITIFWKVSLHAAGITATAFILTVLYGLVALPVVVCVPVVFWARYVLNKHTPAQLGVGSVIAVTVSAGVFWYFGLL
ncbi:MAG: hypothetical protein K6T91_10770 [Firmicutes bacterium]|nr:hypothetical protein [Bacillota bacterium]